MLLGLFFIAIGVFLAVIWAADFVIALKGALILSLFFWGVIAFLIGLSRRKAKRDYANALHDEIGEDTPDTA